MCIICDKPAGVDLPSEEEIKYMFDHNPNGAGFAIQGWFERTVYDQKKKKYIKKNLFEVHYKKGFMNVDDLLEALGPREKLKDKRVVIHCRIKTSGKTDKATTHPFPLSTCYGDLKREEGDGPVLFHNGVFSGLGGIIDKDSSDTQDFVSGVACKYLGVPHHINKMGEFIAEKIAGSCRVLILYPNANHPEFRMGTWYEHKGCQYSNNGYKTEYTPSSRTYGSSYRGSYSYPYYGYEDLDDELDNTYIQDLLEISNIAGTEKEKSQAEYYKKKDTAHHFDEFGMNDASQAWPNPMEHWIKFRSKERMEAVKHASTKQGRTKDGTQLYSFAYNPHVLWYIDEATMQMYDTAGYKLIIAKHEQEEEELEELWGENMRYFNDYDEIIDFMDEGNEISSNSVLLNGEEWYIDWEELVAYTEKGIKLAFPSGEVGHVKSALKQHGYNKYEHNKMEVVKEKSYENKSLTTREKSFETIRG